MIQLSLDFESRTRRPVVPKDGREIVMKPLEVPCGALVAMREECLQPSHHRG